MKQKLLNITPVLPSADIERDVKWYHEKTGFVRIAGDAMYSILKRDNLFVHLQWHANTDDDPLLGGSVIRIFVNDIQLVYEEFVERRAIEENKLRLKTAWGTNEFGFYDLNNNAIFIVEDI